jgi:hypothetical protein
MDKEALLRERQEILKHQLATGKYNTLAGLLLGRVDNLIRKISHTSQVLPPSYCALVLALTTLAVDFAVSLILGESHHKRIDFIPVEVLSAGIAVCVLLAIRFYSNVLWTNLRSHIVDSIEATADVEKLQKWLTSSFTVKRAFIFSLFVGMLFVALSPVNLLMWTESFFSLGVIILTSAVYFQLAMGMYYLLVVVTWPFRIRNFHFKLFSADPSSSGVVKRLSNMTTNYVFVVAVLAAMITLLVIVSGPVTFTVLVILIILAWVPLTTIFLSMHLVLASIITKAKLTILNDIQTQVEELLGRDRLMSRTTLDHVDKLMKCHDRIKSTPNSALDFHAVLGYFNSLLVPIVGVLLGNLEKIISYLIT